MIHDEKSEQVVGEVKKLTIGPQNKIVLASPADIAAAVEARAKSLLPPDPEVTVTQEFVKDCLDSNERGDGVLYATLNAGQFLANVTPKENEWYTWDNHVWAVDETRRSFAAVEEVALEYQAQAEILERQINEEGIESKKGDGGWKVALHDKYQSRVNKLRTVGGVEKCLTWAPIVDPKLCVREGDFDQKPMLLPVANGVIDLRTGVLQKGRPEDRLTRRIDVAYNPHANYEPWLEFVADITAGKEGMPEFIQRSIGYGMTGYAHEQYIWVFIGPGRNGKGVLFNLIGEILGPYYHEINRGMIVEQRNEASPSATSEHLYSLMGKRLAVGSETNKGQKIDLGAVKKLTGEDKVTCRPNFRSEVSFNPTHTLMLHTNHMPVGLTKDFAILQRLLKIEFPNMYVDNPEKEKQKQPLHAERFCQKDPLLKKKLRDCKEGILRWMVEGCLSWQQIGIAPPPQVAEWVDKEAEENDYFGQFIKDCIDPGDPEKVRLSSTELYQAFQWWWSVNMDSRDQRCPAVKTLTTSLRELGHDISKRGGKIWANGMSISHDVVQDIAEHKAKS